MPDLHDIAIDLKQLTGGGLRLDQYLGLWCVESGQFRQLLDHVSTLDLAAHVAAHAGEPIAAVKTSKQGGGGKTIGIVSMEGILTKYGSSLSTAGSMIRTRKELRAMASDESIDAIVLRIDTPGGTVAGTADVAREVARARAKKPVWAYVEDLCASAGYWIGSQADRIVANQPTAYVGSIGTYYATYDLSGAAAQQGIKAILIKSGEFKGAGLEGTEITPEQIAEWQSLVDKLQIQFNAGVSTGRKMAIEAVEKLADGRVHLAADAQALGLIDAISPFDEMISELRTQLSSSNPKGPKNMSATLQELKAACPDAGNDFLIAQLEAGAETEAASQAYMKELVATAAAEKARADTAEVDRAEAVADARKASAKKPGSKVGNDTIGENSDAPAAADPIADPIAEFKGRVAVMVAAGTPKQRATSKVATDDPDLHAAYVDAYNAANNRRVEFNPDPRR